MKYYLAALLLVSAQAYRLSGVDEETIRSGNHWRRKWPEGHTDDGTDDDVVLERFNHPDPKKNKPKPKEQYPWSYDEDVISTGEHIKNAETKLKNKLTYDSVAIQRGRDWTWENNKAASSTFAMRTDKAPPASE